jgi:hypothetical protein
LDKVDSNELPADTTIGFSSSPLIIIFTGPVCTSRFCATSSIKTSNRIIVVKATIEDKINIENQGLFRLQIYRLRAGNDIY